jgi:hypothetical protein
MKRAPGFDEVTEVQSGGVSRKTGALRLWTQLEKIYRNKCITAEEYDAGRKYYADWYLAGFAPRVTSRMAEWVQNNSGSLGNMDAAERRVFHAKRFAEANRILECMGLRKAVHWLVINEIPAENIGRKYRGYRNGRAASASAITAISIGLTQLAKFYGLIR